MKYCRTLYHCITATRNFVSYPYAWWRNLVRRRFSLSGFVNETLSKNAAMRHVTHPTLSSIHMNSLRSNRVMEDNHVIRVCPNTGVALLTVIDGHGGVYCSEHIKQSIATYVANHLRAEMDVEFSDIFEYPDNCYSSASTLNNGASEEIIGEVLKKSFVDLDNDMSQAALNAIKQGNKTQTHVMQIRRALTGACVNALLFYGRNMVVANTGDCRSVLGRREGNKWVCVSLSTDHTCRNLNEVNRIKEEHPGEERTVFRDDRLFGSLMPLRSFGDVMFKWENDQLRAVGQSILPNYFTAPYLTAEPELTHQQLTDHDKFAIIATDGLWDCLSSGEVVNIVGSMLNQQGDDNIATVLLKAALGRDDHAVYEMLKLTPPESRAYRDDITIIVVTFK